MDERFDPYHAWLSIPPKDQPPHHYRLLGLELFESADDVIQRAADRQRSYLHQHQSGPHSRQSQQLLSEVSQAALCLLDSERKSQYDAALRTKLAAERRAAVPAQPPRATVPPMVAPPVATPPLPTPPPLVVATSESKTRRSQSSTVRKDARTNALWIGIGTAVAAIVVLGLVVYAATNGGRQSGNTAQVPQKPGGTTPTPAAPPSPDEPEPEPTPPVASSDKTTPPDEPVTPPIAAEPPVEPTPVTPTKPADPAHLPERSLADLVNPAPAPKSVSPAASDSDRRLWVYARGFFEALPDGTWQELLPNGNLRKLRQVKQNQEYVELAWTSGSRIVRLYANRLESNQEVPTQFKKRVDGAWLPHFDTLQLGDAKEEIERAEATYRRAIAKARKDLLKEFDDALAAVRRRGGKPEDKLAATKTLEEEKTRFERTGLVPWSLAMRVHSRNYVAALPKAARPADEAFDKLSEKLIAAKDDRTAATLTVWKRKLTTPTVVANFTFQVNGGGAKIARRLLSNGHVDSYDGRWTWSLDKAGLGMTGSGSDGKIYLDRMSISDAGVKFTIKNNDGVEGKGSFLSEP